MHSRLPTAYMTTQGITKLGERTKDPSRKGITLTLSRNIPNIGICQAEDAEEYQIPKGAREHQTRAGSTSP